MAIIGKIGDIDIDDCVYRKETGDFIYSSVHKIITEIVSKEDEATMKAIERYCEENNIIPNIIEKEKLDLVLKLGVQALQERELGGEK